jgi:SAM-dependent methyltransferase
MSPSTLKNLFSIIDVNNKNVLDLGSGTGMLLFICKVLGSKTTKGIEINEQNLLAINSSVKIIIDFEVGDFLNKNYLKSNFDVVFSIVGTKESWLYCLTLFKINKCIKTLVMLKPTYADDFKAIDLYTLSLHYIWGIEEIKLSFATSRQRRTLIILKKNERTKHSELIQID